MSLQIHDVISSRMKEKQGKNCAIHYTYMSEFSKNFQTKNSLLPHVYAQTFRAADNIVRGLLM